MPSVRFASLKASLIHRCELSDMRELRHAPSFLQNFLPIHTGSHLPDQVTSCRLYPLAENACHFLPPLSCASQWTQSYQSIYYNQVQARHAIPKHWIYACFPILCSSETSTSFSLVWARVSFGSFSRSSTWSINITQELRSASWFLYETSAHLIWHGKQQNFIPLPPASLAILRAPWL